MTKKQQQHQQKQIKRLKQEPCSHLVYFIQSQWELSQNDPNKQTHAIGDAQTCAERFSALKDQHWRHSIQSITRPFQKRFREVFGNARILIFYLSIKAWEEKSLPKSYLGWFFLVFGEGKATKENISIFWFIWPLNQNFNSAAQKQNIFHMNYKRNQTWARDHLNISNLSADNFKNTWPRWVNTWARDTLKWILVSEYPVLIAVNWSQRRSQPWCPMDVCIISFPVLSN